MKTLLVKLLSLSQLLVMQLHDRRDDAVGRFTLQERLHYSVECETRV